MNDYGCLVEVCSVVLSSSRWDHRGCWDRSRRLRAVGLQRFKAVPNPCPRFAPGSVIQQPAALFSQNGVLAVQFSYQTTTDSANRTLFCFMTPSGLENPTLHVNPGDHLIITVTNNTPAQPLHMIIDPPNCGPGGNKMTLSSLNIHYYGTNTSPTRQSDEVIKTLINSGQTFQYNVAFPANEPPGLYWYHPHIHGIAEAAVLAGASGALVVDGIENVQPAVADLRQRILVIRDQPTVPSLQTPPVIEGSGGDPSGVSFQDKQHNDEHDHGHDEESRGDHLHARHPSDGTRRETILEGFQHVGHYS
jgi:FtsP/CotA-like multicopper oxidase with cupredoxin domain